jgi:hypothetical protein
MKQGTSGYTHNPSYQEAEIRRITVGSQLGQIILVTLLKIKAKPKNNNPSQQKGSRYRP